MSKRIMPVDPEGFTRLFFTLMLESEERDDLPDEEELFERALEQFGEEALAAAFVVRFENFWQMMGSSEAEAHLGGDEGEIKFHPAMLEAAATLRTRQNGSFPERQFFSKVAELRAGKFADFAFSPPE